jgi:nicotinamidase-related amidase
MPFPWAESALLIVDATQAFFGPRVPPVEAARELRSACGLPAWEAAERLVGVLEAARATGRPVIYTKPDFTETWGTTTIGQSKPKPDWYGEIPDPLSPREGERILVKSKASAFFGTPLAAFLLGEGIRGVLVAGGATSGCVRATVVDASSHGLAVGLLHDGCFDRAALSHAVTIHEMDVKYATAVACSEATEALYNQRFAPAPET